MFDCENEDDDEDDFGGGSGKRGKRQGLLSA
jgi:hypothetical protein